MLTAHLLTKNNRATIQKALESVRLADQIVVADLGSTDGTIQICEAAGAKVTRTRKPRHEARSDQSTSEWNLLIEPWEVLTNSPDIGKPDCYYSTIIQSKTITKEVRLWYGPRQFVNPVFERVDADPPRECGLVFFSSGRTDHEQLLQELEKWKSQEICSSAPYYYQACLLMALGRYDEFLRVSEHYMFMEPKAITMSSTMNRYYYAMVQMMHKKQYRAALQNLNLCLCCKPLMAEFWCLMGDVYYHLLKNFKSAKEFYENAMILGCKRLKSDRWPMDISKYKAYPKQMIDSCDQLVSMKSTYLA